MDEQKKPKRNPILDNLPRSSFQAVGQPNLQNPNQPAHDNAGIQGAPPLPTGHPVSIDPASLTPTERAGLESIGWREGQPIPSNLAEQIALMKAQIAAETTNPEMMPPPTAEDGTLPPALEMPPETDIDDLSPEHRAMLQQELKNAGKQMDAMQQSSNLEPMTSDQGVKNAAAGVVDKTIPINDDREEWREGLKKPPETSRTTDNSLKVCPHCEWDLNVQDPIEATDTDKHNFLQAVLGGINCQKIYELFDGAMQITVRQLTPFELDACYKQVYYENDKESFSTHFDFLEQVMRYRISLQIVDIRSTVGKIYDAPETLDEWSKKFPIPVEAVEEGKEPPKPSPTSLPQISKYVYYDVLKTESLVRIASKVVNEYNRLISKLEVMIDSSDFWKGIEPQS